MRNCLYAVLIGAVTLALAARGEPPAQGHKQSSGIGLFPPDTTKWQKGPPSLPKGALIAVLEGDPTKEGPFVFRLKLPDGYRVPPHTHPKTERVTVISGTFNIGMGDTFDDKATKAMPAGAYGYWEAGMKHFVWAKGETVLQFHGMGPWSIRYVNPEEDPRKQKGAASEKIKSGPQVGDPLPGLVYGLVCLDAQPEMVGKKSELVVERYGPKPGVLIFARDLDEQLGRLIQRLDLELASDKAASAKQPHGLVVLLSDDEALEGKVKDFGAKRNISRVTVAIDESAGPPKWKVSPDADVTIIVYDRFKVARNYALSRGDLKGETIDMVLADVSKILGR